MYLKVYYNNLNEIASVEEVEAALPQDMEDLTVDNVLNHPSVEFPKNATYADRERVREALQNAGFETE